MSAGVVFLHTENLPNTEISSKLIQKSMIKVLVGYNKNMIVIYSTLFLVMLNDNYTQRHILLLQTI